MGVDRVGYVLLTRRPVETLLRKYMTRLRPRSHRLHTPHEEELCQGEPTNYPTQSPRQRYSRPRESLCTVFSEALGQDLKGLVLVNPINLKV